MSEEAKATERSNERLRIWLGFFKFVLGTVALGVVTVWLDNRMEERKQAYEERKAENAFIAQFVDRALDNNLEKRRDFAEYFIRLIPDGPAQDRWEDYSEYVDDLVLKSIERDEEIEKRERKLDELRREAARNRRKGNKQVEELAEKIQKLEGEVSSERRELAVLRSETPRTSPIATQMDATVEVPHVTSVTRSHALYLLGQHGLAVRKITMIQVQGVSGAGIVTSQSPRAGTKVLRGSGVDLWISMPP